MGTDLAWAKTQTWVFGERWGPVFEKMIAGGMGKSDYGVCGPGYVGEEDVESWACKTPYWEGKGGMGDAMEGVEVERSFDRGGANNPIDLDESDADDLETDEAQGLGLLDGMGNVRMEEEQHEHELEESDFEIDVDV